MPNIKNGGVPPPITDRRVEWIPIGCQKCIECTKKKGREWTVRLLEEIRQNKDKKHFVTLTFNTESYRKLYNETEGKGYEKENNIATVAMRRFLERWRKKYKKSVRHWCVTELGGGRYEHMHIHGIIMTNIEAKEIEAIWNYGYVYIGTHVGEDTVNYIVKYINKYDEKHPSYYSKILTSNGIGKGYNQRIDAIRNKYKAKNTNEMYHTRQGVQLPLPIYYRNKVYNEKEREKLWIEKLDKNERYVMGIKIDMNRINADKEYIQLRNEARIISKKAGYGKPTTWKEQEYEHNRRLMIQKERLRITDEIKEKTIPIGKLEEAW